MKLLISYLSFLFHKAVYYKFLRVLYHNVYLNLKILNISKMKYLLYINLGLVEVNLY